jgi:hypothetical protein
MMATPVSSLPRRKLTPPHNATPNYPEHFQSDHGASVRKRRRLCVGVRKSSAVAKSALEHEASDLAPLTSPPRGRGLPFEQDSRSHLWINMVERFFAETTRKRARRGVFKSVDELKQAIIDYLDKHNDQPKLKVWDNSSTAGTGSRSPTPASRACSPSTSHPSVQTSPTSAPPLLRSGLAQATQRWLAAFKSKKGVCR